MEFVEIMQEHSCEDTSAHIAYEMKQHDPLMGWPVHNLQSPDSRADGKAVEWCSQIEQEAYVAADQDISEHLEENIKLNINDENNSYNEVDVTCIDDEISKNKSPTMKNGQKKQETYAAADQDMSEHLKENSKLNINDVNNSYNEVDVTCIDDEISKNKSPTMKNGQKKQETYVAADQDMSEHLKENSKLNINDENNSYNEVDVNCIDGEISKNKSPTMKNHVTHDAIKPHRCQICGKEFVLFERLKIHMDTHTGIKKCEACGEEFGTFGMLKTHVEGHAGIKKNKCGTCGMKFGGSDHLKTHMARTGHKHKCTICSKTFTRSGHLKKHITEHITAHTVKIALMPHELMSLKEEEFVRFGKLKSHTGIKKHKCGTCGKEFSTCSSLKMHMRTHAGIKKHKCGTCGRAFSRSDTLKNHMITHTGIKKHKCGTCGKEFCRSRSLQAHMIAHTALNKCGICGKKISTAYNLKVHMVTHTGLKKHKCMICRKAFSQYAHLQKHMTTHELINLNEEFFLKKKKKNLNEEESEKLKSHVETHTGIKIHKCSTCGKEFSRSYHLNNHTKTHTGLKEHKCTICSKAFGRSDHLKRHMKTHKRRTVKTAVNHRN